MKYILIFFINVYKALPGPWHGMCRFYPTCSSYAIEALNEYGFIKGSIMSIKRIIRCNHKSKIWYDPVPKNIKKKA